jgi:hypothetical protein
MIEMVGGSISDVYDFDKGSISVDTNQLSRSASFFYWGEKGEGRTEFEILLTLISARVTLITT